MKALSSLLRSFACNAALVGLPLAFIAVAVHPAAAFAQRGPEQRIVQGRVLDAANATVKGAIVYLKDTRSLAMKSYITDDQGTYRFGQLSQTTDYSLWAEANGKKSNTRTISSFDSKNTFHMDLKLEK